MNSNLFALGAMVCWGMGDFFIQRSCRTVGNVKTLFTIGVFGLVGLFPFVAYELFSGPLPIYTIELLSLAAIIMFFTTLFDFEALKEGKIAVIEPIIGFELPLTIGLSVLLLNEHLSWLQIIATIAVFVGTMSIVTTHRLQLHYHRRVFERGVVYAGLGAIGLALTNFTIGLSSRESTPLLTVWWVDAIHTALTFAYLIGSRQFRSFLKDITISYKNLLLVGVFDNAAWIFYAFATAVGTISISNAISESYIALAAMLGVFVNHERLKPHQRVGIIVALAGVISLSFMG